MNCAIWLHVRTFQFSNPVTLYVGRSERENLSDGCQVRMSVRQTDRTSPPQKALQIWTFSHFFEKYTVKIYTWEIQGKRAQKSFAFGRFKYLFSAFGQRIWSLMFWLDTAWSRECIWIYIQPYSYFPNQPSFGAENINLHQSWLEAPASYWPNLIFYLSLAFHPLYHITTHLIPYYCTLIIQLHHCINRTSHALLSHVFTYHII